MSEWTYQMLFAGLFLCCEVVQFAYGVSGISNEPRQGEINNLTAEWTLEPWISSDVKFGQVSGVSVDQDDNIYIFHRDDRVWDEKSFTLSQVYTGQKLGPIQQPTILVFNSNGKLLRQMGSNMFFLPHGITVDSDYNVWVTDVALHQVMKLSQHSNKSSLTLGQRFTPGSGLNNFCKPTSVAVASNGDFFVADGYCNSRIIKYNSNGEQILQWGRKTNTFRPPGKYDFNIPHALTLAEDKGAICTADREYGRIMCYRIADGGFVKKISSSIIGNRIFSVAYSSIFDGLLFAVNGRTANTNVPVGGFVISPSGAVLGKFGSNLNMPHDIALSSNACNIYVVEIGPYRAWKYANKNCNQFAATLPQEDSHSNKNVYSRNIEGLTGAVLVTIACFVFAFGLFMAVLIYSKARNNVSSDTKRLLSNVDY